MVDNILNEKLKTYTMSFQASEILIPMSFFATVFGLYYLRSRENLSLIDKGMNPRKNYSSSKPYVYMKYALLLIGAGLGLLIAYIVDVVWLHEATKYIDKNGVMRHNDTAAIYFSLLAIGGGLGMFYAYKLERKHWVDKKEEQN